MLSWIPAGLLTCLALQSLPFNGYPDSTAAAVAVAHTNPSLSDLRRPTSLPTDKIVGFHRLSSWRAQASRAT